MIIKANIYWSLTTCQALCCFPCILSFNLHLPHPPSYWYYHPDFVGEETELCDMAKITQWEVLGTFLFARLIIQFNISNIICRPQVLPFPTFFYNEQRYIPLCSGKRTYILSFTWWATNQVSCRAVKGITFLHDSVPGTITYKV